MLNKELSTRFCITLPREAAEELYRQADSLNLSVSAYAGQLLLKHLNFSSDNQFLPEQISNMISEAVKEKAAGETFTVADLLPAQWKQLSRGQKGIAAKSLAALERESEDIVKFKIVSNTTVYLKKGV
ncbi:hypothetical protein SAMN04487760_10549 [Lachnospiraceae bacterium G41]|nr:hypothetical protein SAMN04487760_10549 [Lachnospiraceae bacterium G41]